MLAKHRMAEDDGTGFLKCRLSTASLASQMMLFVCRPTRISLTQSRTKLMQCCYDCWSNAAAPFHGVDSDQCIGNVDQHLGSKDPLCGSSSIA